MTTLDPVALFARLTNSGTAPNCVLLEAADVKTRKGEKSILMPKAALKATCRGLEVKLEAFTEFGEQKRLEILEKTPLQFTKPDRNQSLEKQLKHPSPLDVLRVMSQLPGVKMTLGAFSYDYVDLIEDLPEAKQDLFGFPDYVFWIPENLIVIDHVKNQVRVWEQGQETSPPTPLHPVERGVKEGEILNTSPAVRPPLRKGERGLGGEVDISDADFSKLVLECKEHILAGDVFQIVPSRTFSVPCEDAFETYQRLKIANPSPYMFYVNEGDFKLFGSSPETFIRVSGDPKTVEICPIAGTRTRGANLDEDSRKEAELRLDIKEQAEHMMLVDLARNDIARVSKTGTRYVSDLLTVDRYSHVMHLVSHVTGELREDLDALHAFQASLNMGTLVGAPKVKAAEILRQVEHSKRGIYGGAIGYLDNHGNLNTAIMIRSALVKDKTAYVRAGAGVVYDSDPAFEVQETYNKAQAVLNVLSRSQASDLLPSPQGGEGLGVRSSILLIDNFDSFTFNLEAEFKNLGCNVQVWRNNISADQALEIALAMPEPRLIVLSPGPGAPADAGCCIELIQKCQDQVPILGVCLGHQAMIEAFGGVVGRAEATIHGKSVLMTHQDTSIFAGLVNPMPIARYHSLAGTRIPEDLRVLASCENTVMAIEHKKYKMLGVQFHPESILTPEGSKLIKSILAWSQS
jgi:anthranilate synthase component 1